MFEVGVIVVPEIGPPNGSVAHPVNVYPDNVMVPTDARLTAAPAVPCWEEVGEALPVAPVKVEENPEIIDKKKDDKSKTIKEVDREKLETKFRIKLLL